jgi:hypothetical protein
MAYIRVKAYLKENNGESFVGASGRRRRGEDDFLAAFSP